MAGSGHLAIADPASDAGLRRRLRRADLLALRVLDHPACEAALHAHSKAGGARMLCPRVLVLVKSE